MRTRVKHCSKHCCDLWKRISKRDRVWTLIPQESLRRRKEQVTTGRISTGYRMNADAHSHSAPRSGRWSSAPRQIPRALRIVLAVASLSVLASNANAWLYPEHRDISLLAVQRLDADRQAVFARLWQDARAGDEQRLCAQGADTDQGVKPSCLDWAALAAIAGDHSCSSSELLATARSADWILSVAAIAAQLKVDLAQIPIVPPEESVNGSDRAA